ncbi:MAG TPA: PAS domain S-box protein, partial [Patescibacteria group bacterium]|nr:PAS domain S-box protein [Patescibacteria group bacterium]
LQKVTAALQGSQPLPEILQKILDGVTEGLDVDRAILYLYDADRRVLKGAQAALRHPAKSGFTPPHNDTSMDCLQAQVTGVEIPVEGTDEVMSATVLLRRPFVADHLTGIGGSNGGALQISGAIRAALKDHSFVTAPLLAQDRVVGVLTVDNFRRSVPFRERMHLLMAYGAQAGLAIERTLLEEKLRASEQRYRQFIEHSPDGIVETTLDGRFISCNDGILRLLGYTREELFKLNARDLYVDESRRDELIARNMADGKVEGMVVAIRRRNGGTAYVSATSRLRHGPDEPVLECIIRDVTERYEAERRLRTLTDVVTYSADAIVSVDPGCRITSWNVGAQLVFGYSAEEMTGQPYQRLVPQDRLDEFLHIIRSRVEKEGHLVGFETERLHRDGSRIPVSLSVTRLRHNGGPDLGWSVVVRDITQRKREEQQRRLLSSITLQSPDAILSVDRKGRITSWNLGAEKMFGYSAPEIVGHPWLELAPAERQADYLMVAGPQAAGEAASPPGEGVRAESPQVVDTLARTRNGGKLPVRLSASVLRAENGDEVGWSIILRDLTEQKTLAEISERLQEELYSRNRLEGIVGNSRAMEEVRERIRRVARFTSSVMLVGGSGTGKEIVANAIHYNSPRSRMPFVKVNCAAIPEDLLESELFGIERNVATGVDGRIGRFEMSNGGTLFLDEIGDMSLATQAKILRVLQEREFERVGGKKLIKVDVRIIAATNKDLQAEIKARRFRDDLYYRLNVIVITLPPLADRREDIDPLIDHFLAKVTAENHLPRRKLSLSARMLLNEYDWPGNVRELEHCIERAVVMSEGAEIVEADLPSGILIWKETRSGDGETGGDGAAVAGSGNGHLGDIMRQVERRTLVEALDRSGWVQAKAARLLGISERSMWYRVKKLGLRPPEI